MAELVYRSVELRTHGTTKRWFDVTEGLWGGVRVRGEDVIIPAAAGRWARNRLDDFRIVRLHGWVWGDTEAEHRTNMDAVMVAFDPAADPADLVIHAPLYGVAAGMKTISVRTIDSRMVQIGMLATEMDVELHCISTPPDWS